MYSTQFVEIVFLPKNATTRLQPLDSGIIKSFNAKYYRYLLSSIVNKISSTKHAESLFKEITLKDGIIYISYAWKDITQSTIINCWVNTGLVHSNNNISTNETADIDNFNELIERFDIIDKIDQEEILELNLKPQDHFCDPYFLSLEKEEITSDVDHDLQTNNEENREVTPKLSVEVAFNYFHELKSFLVSINNITSDDIISIMNIDKMLNKEELKNKQKIIMDYFSKI